MTSGKTLQLSSGEWAGGASPARRARGPLVVEGPGWLSEQVECTGDPRGEQLGPFPVHFTQ